MSSRINRLLLSHALASTLKHLIKEDKAADQPVLINDKPPIGVVKPVEVDKGQRYALLNKGHMKNGVPRRNGKRGK